MARRLLDSMPGAQRAAIATGLAGLEAAALARYGHRLGRLDPERRAQLLGALAAAGPLGAASLDGLKAIVMLAAGADGFAGEIAATAALAAPARPDPELALVDPDELGEVVACDAIVVGSGAGGAFAARALARAGHEVIVVEEGERWTVQRIRDSHPLERFAGLYREAGATIALGVPPIALPLGRAVGGTTVINSGTCYRPPAAVAREWHGRARVARRRGRGARRAPR